MEVLGSWLDKMPSKTMTQATCAPDSGQAIKNQNPPIERQQSSRSGALLGCAAVPVLLKTAGDGDRCAHAAPARDQPHVRTQD
jgi:hypothetical protein